MASASTSTSTSKFAKNDILWYQDIETSEMREARVKKTIGMSSLAEDAKEEMIAQILATTEEKKVTSMFVIVSSSEGSTQWGIPFTITDFSEDVLAFAQERKKAGLSPVMSELIDFAFTAEFYDKNHHLVELYRANNIFFSAPDKSILEMMSEGLASGEISVTKIGRVVSPTLVRKLWS
jgi:hypothetical protein